MRSDDLQIGMGITFYVSPNCYPYTIVKIINEKRMVIQEDKWTRLDNESHSDRQVYEYMPNLSGKKYTISLRKNGKCVPTGWNMNWNKCFYFGARRRYDGSVK